MSPSTPRLRRARQSAWLAGFAALAAHAQQTDITLGVSSALVSRGILLGRNEPSLQASAAYYAAGGGYVGLSGATLRLPSEHEHTVQLAAKAGWLVPLGGDWVGNLALEHFAYPFDPAWRGLAYDELSVGVAYADLAVGSLSWLRHAEDYTAGSRASMAADLVGRCPLGHGVALTAGIGVHDLGRRYGYRYTYGHAGLGLRRGRMSVDLAYTLTDATAKARYGTSAADRWTASVAWNF